MAAALQDRTRGAQQAQARRTIPFDHAFRYELEGEPGNVHQSTVTVSIESAFVAVSIGYGVIAKFAPARFGVKPPPPAPLPGPGIPLALVARPPLSGITVGELVESLADTFEETTSRGQIGPQVAAALANGFRLNPDFAERVLLSGLGKPVDEKILPQLFQVMTPPVDQVQFLYALFDEGTGREFQSEPILNIAGLGISNGDRPFRYFAQPITFAPRSTIRMEVRETSDFQGELHVALHGYKVLGGAGTPTGRLQSQAETSRRRVRRMHVARPRR